MSGPQRGEEEAALWQKKKKMLPIFFSIRFMPKAALITIALLIHWDKYVEAMEENKRFI